MIVIIRIVQKKKSESKSFIVPQDFPKEKNIDDQEEMSKILDAR